MNIQIKNMLLAKMSEMKIKDYSEAELQRVFGECVAPNSCIKGVRQLLKDGELT